MQQFYQMTLREMIKQNSELIIVDTRIKEHFKEGHIKGAVNLSYTSLKSMNKILEKKIKGYCYLFRGR